MGWVTMALLALCLGAALWRFAALNRGALMFIAAGLLIALAGYAWQGQPDLQGRPKARAARQAIADSDFGAARGDMLGRFDRASSWLTMAESYHRRGDSESAVNIIRSGLRQSPNDLDLWLGLGNFLVLHADGLMTPAASLAFRRAAALAPGHPAPPFFYGLALVQSRRYDEAETLWRRVLANSPPGTEWRPMVEQRLRMLQQIRAAGQGREGAPSPPPVAPSR